MYAFLSTSRVVHELGHSYTLFLLLHGARSALIISFLQRSFTVAKGYLFCNVYEMSNPLLDFQDNNLHTHIKYVKLVKIDPLTREVASNDFGMY